MSGAIEWLERVTADGFVPLLNECGGNLAIAAYKLARVRNLVNGYVKPTPTVGELVSAARHICTRTHLTMWERNTLVTECRLTGFEVIE